MNPRNNRAHANTTQRNTDTSGVFAGDERAASETLGYVLLIVITVTAFAVLLAFAPGALTEQQHSITHDNTVSEFNNLHDTVTRTVHSPPAGSNTVRVGTQGGIIHTPGDAPTSEQTITVRALDDNGDVIHEHETVTNPITFENPDGTIHYEHGAVTWAKNNSNSNDAVEGMSREPEWVFNTEHSTSTSTSTGDGNTVLVLLNHSRNTDTGEETGERVITGSERGGAEITITNTDTPFNTANTGTSGDEHEHTREQLVENTAEIEVEIETLAPNAWETYLNNHNPTTTTTTSETVGDEYTNTVTGVFPANTVTIDEHDIELAPA